MLHPTQISELIESLAPDERERVESYLSFVLAQHATKVRTASDKNAQFRFDWAGGLSEFKGQFDAVVLQKKAMEWMGGTSR